MSKTLKTLIVILVLLILGAGGVYAYPYVKNYYNSGKITSKNDSTLSPTASTSVTPTSTETITHVSDPGVTWLAEPQKLDNLHLFKEYVEGGTTDNVVTNDIAYYKVADLKSGGEVILSIGSSLGMVSGDIFARFKKINNEYSYLANHSFEKNSQEADKWFQTDKNIIFDSTTRYISLSAPDFLKLEEITMKSASTFLASKMYSQLTSPVKIVDTEYGTLYRVASGNRENVAEENGFAYYVKLVDTSLINYSIKFDFQTDDEVSLITWKDGTKNSAKYTPEGYVGCGSGSSINEVTNTANIASRLTEAGTTGSGEKVYIVAKDDAVMAAAYENYKVGRTEGILTLEQFAAQKPVFIYKDGLSEYVIFTSREYAGLAECGKPVIYLYPEKDTQVSVKVGADITKSEPLYQNGWTALASPSGKLIVNGKSYDSLFWEGLGNGIYPNIDQGFIVKKEDLKSTLEDHLSQLGLNLKESADFMDFWWPKMPQTPYTRLTWFGTKQMNQLAPLSVSPKPDTTIRIFLDFEGLNNPIDIQPQKLSSIPRKGFTLIEWGGLLKGK